MVEVGQWGPEPFLDRSGSPLTSLTISVYESDGTTLADLYTNQDGDTALANPLPTGVATTAAGLDVRGNGNFYAVPGAYVLAAIYNGNEVYRSPITVGADDDTSGSDTTWPLDHTGATAAEDAVTLDVTGDTQNRFVLDHDGTHHWGSGAAATDVSIYRGGDSYLVTEIPSPNGGSTSILNGDPDNGPKATVSSSVFADPTAGWAIHQVGYWDGGTDYAGVTLVAVADQDAYIEIDNVPLKGNFDAAVGRLYTSEQFEARMVLVTGFTGSTTDIRFVGATASGAPASGAHLIGDVAFALDQHLYICTAAGTPGTWAEISRPPIGNWTDLGNLGATETITGVSDSFVRDFGTLDQACAITVSLSDNQQIDLALIQGGAGGFAATFVGVDSWTTSDGDPPDLTDRATGDIDFFYFEQINGVTYGQWGTEPAGGAGATSPLTLTSTAAGQIPLTIKAHASQTANLEEWQTSAGTILIRVRSDGLLVFESGEGAYLNATQKISMQGVMKLGDVGSFAQGFDILSASQSFAVKGHASQSANLQEWRNSGGTVLAAMSANGAFIQGINAQVGTSYTLVAADAGDLVTMTNGSASTLDVPQDSDASIPIGAYTDIIQLGGGQVTVQAGAGATLRVSGLTAKARAQYSRLSVQKIAANTWSLMGDLAAS